MCSIVDSVLITQSTPSSPADSPYTPPWTCTHSYPAPWSGWFTPPSCRSSLSSTGHRRVPGLGWGTGSSSESSPSWSSSWTPSSTRSGESLSHQAQDHHHPGHFQLLLPYLPGSEVPVPGVVHAPSLMEWVRSPVQPSEWIKMLSTLKSSRPPTDQQLLSLPFTFQQIKILNSFSPFQSLLFNTFSLNKMHRVRLLRKVGKILANCFTLFVHISLLLFDVKVGKDQAKVLIVFRQ